MISQDLVNAVIGILGAVFGWVLKVIWDAIKDLQHELREMEAELHTKYVHKDDFRSDMDEIKSWLTKILDKLEQKVDK